MEVAKHRRIRDVFVCVFGCFFLCVCECVCVCMCVCVCVLDFDWLLPRPWKH